MGLGCTLHGVALAQEKTSLGRSGVLAPCLCGAEPVSLQGRQKVGAHQVAQGKSQARKSVFGDHSSGMDWRCMKTPHGKPFARSAG